MLPPPAPMVTMSSMGNAMRNRAISPGTLAPASITITLEALSEEEVETGRTRVIFDQSYETATYSDKVRKTVLLVWEDESWRIALEESEPLA